MPKNSQSSSSKGISAVIAVILLLLITIAIVGVAFTFFQRTTQTATQSGEQQLKQQVSQIGTQLAIENANRNQVVIRNTGTVPLAGLAFYVNNADVNYAGPALLNSSQVGTYFLNDSQLAMLPDPAELRVTTAGFSNHITADFYGRYTVGYWKLDEGSGTSATDSSGNSNNGELINGPSWVSGRYGSALQFDGVDDYVEAPASVSLDVTSQITVEAWINLDEVTGNSDQDIIVNKENIPYEIAVHDAGCTPLNTIPRYNYVWYLGGVSGLPNDDCGWKDTGGLVQKGAWTHLLLTYDGSTARAYINGVLQKSYPGSGAIQTTACTLRIGGRNGCPASATASSFFKGTIDEVRILNVARQP